MKRGKGCPHCNYEGTVRVLSYIHKTVEIKPCPYCTEFTKPPVPPPPPSTEERKIPVRVLFIISLFVVAIFFIGWQLFKKQDGTVPPITTLPKTSIPSPIPTQIIYEKTEFQPYPINCIEKSPLEKLEYETKKFPLPVPMIYTGAIVCNLGKVKEGIYEKMGKIYIFNFSSEEEAQQFVSMMEDRYKRSNSDAYPKKDTIGPLDVYFRYSNNGQYRGSFYYYDKYVYYLDLFFSEKDDRRYIQNEFIEKALPKEVKRIIEFNESIENTTSFTPLTSIEPTVKSVGFVDTLVNFVRDIFPYGNKLRCSDGTPYNKCSKNKPYFCDNGTLILRASICGCPADYRVVQDQCEEIPRCSDGTRDGECSKNKPYFCNNGTFILKASLCGCPKDEIALGDTCISKYQTGPASRTFEYVVRGEKGEIEFTVYLGLKNYLSGLPRYYICNPDCPSDSEIQLRFLDDPQQRKMLMNLVNKIKSKTNESDEQVRIAVSLVQKIPYDWEGFQTDSDYIRYPYEVLYDNRGVCAEKSRLLAFTLRELGYGVVLFEYSAENHMAVGIKCPVEYSYKKSGYCFIESTSPTIITDSEGDYIGAGKLSSTPIVIKISDGKSFDSVFEEYNDAKEWNSIYNDNGPILDSYTYSRWVYLVKKYGIEFNNY